MDAVVFALKTPLASWTDTGAQYRPTDLVPTWSALVGMVGAAMGWQRGDKQLVGFAGSFAPAFRVENVGERITDFHTIESPQRAALGKHVPKTRRQELELAGEKNKVNTSITQREYVQDAQYQVALVRVSGSDDLAHIAAALESPRYPLYAGRRSCPISALKVELFHGDSLEECIPGFTHWDTRIDAPEKASVVRERRDLLIRASEPRRFGLRHEATR